MSSRNYETQILDSIQMIVDNAISKANFDKTIKAIVSGTSNAAEGKYTVLYQGNPMVVYSSNPDVRYTKNMEVYVLIPGNDATQRKVIIGAVDNLGLDYTSIVEGDAGYEIIGTNTINSEKVFELCSYVPEDIRVLYDRDNNINLINFNTQSFDVYTENSNYLICGAKFRTALPLEQQVQGEFGIAFDVDYQSGEEIITKTYIVNTDNMVGMPYSLVTDTRQYAIFNIDSKNLLSVKQIYIFEYNFPNTSDTIEPNDIFVSEIELQAANALTTEELSSTALTLITKKGLFFDKNHIDTDNLSIEAQVKVKGLVLGEGADIKYYWFRENNQIVATHSLYNRLGGPGWECLNEYNPYQNDTQNIEWVPGSHIFNTSKAENIANKTKYKCVAVYNKETVLQKEFVIANYDSEYQITIYSDEGTQFYYDNGRPSLICHINGEENLSEEYTYIWSEVDNNNNFIALTETVQDNEIYNSAFITREELLKDLAAENKLTGKVQQQLNDCNTIIEHYDTVMRIEKNKIHKIDLRKISYFTTYKCSVLKDGVSIGTASIVITNDIISNLSYSLVINNGNQVFKYNEAGTAPNNPSITNPIEILPLSFTLYDKDGKEVSQSLIDKRNVYWTVPMQYTLIEEPTKYEIYKETNDYIEYTGTKTFNFDIHQTFKPTHENNNIQLKVNYQDKVITASTNLTFIKTGEVGTNGTDFICKLIPNTLGALEKVNYPIFTYYNDSQEGEVNFRPAEENKWFKVNFWKNGELIFSGTESGYSLEGNPITLEWMMLQNQYGKKIKDDSNFSIHKNTGVLTFDEKKYEHPANIVKCKITYNETDHYALIPIILVRIENNIHKIDLEADSGFQEVMYTANGNNPTYSDAKPFELQVYENIENEWENVSLLKQNYGVDYDWNVKGQVYYSYWQPELNLVEKTLYASRELKNQKYFEPVNTYNGLCVTNAIECNITRENSLIGTIHIPVYFYLNRYGNSAINGWDGNSISIDENNSGMILAPQVGAGTKNEDNSFTGVFMGSIKEQGEEKEEHGLFGYNAGQRTISLNAEDGSARFGATGKGQIVIDPSTGKALIESGNFSTEAGTGMRIDLSEPSIEFGSGNFKVDKYGRMYASGFSTIEYVDGKKDEIIKEVEELVQKSPFEVILSTEHIFISCDANNVPTKDATYEVNFTGAFDSQPIPTGEVSVLYNDKAIPSESDETELIINNIKITSDASKQHLYFTVKSIGELDNVEIPSNSYLKFKFVYYLEEGTMYELQKTINIAALESIQADIPTCNIIPSAEMFKSVDGPGGPYKPEEIYLYPEISNTNFSKWQYSTNSTTWEDVVSGKHGLEIGTFNEKEHTLKVLNSCDLFLEEASIVSFKCITEADSIYNIVTIQKTYDLIDLTVGGRNLILKSHIFDDPKEFGLEIVNPPVDEEGNAQRSFYLTEVQELNSETGEWEIKFDGQPAEGVTVSLIEEESGDQYIKIDAAENNGGRVHWIHSNVADSLLVDGDQFVFSCEIKGASGRANNNPPLFHYHGTVGNLVMDGEVTNEESRISCSGTWRKVEGYNTDFRFDFTGLVGTYYLSKFKLEKGKNPTDWSLAPEDTQMTAEIEYCIGTSASVPPAEDDPLWGSATQYEADLSKGRYLWSRVKNTSTSGLIVYSKYSCLITYQKELYSQQTEYLLCNSTDIEHVKSEFGESEDWSLEKPTAPIIEDGVVIASKLWSRIHLTYKTILEGTVQYIDEYANYTLDSAWEKMLSVESELNSKISEIFNNTMEGFVRIEGGTIAIGNKIDTPSHLILMNHYGIAFMNKEDNPGWPTAEDIETFTKNNSAWTIDGSLDMNYINVDEIEATYIKNENLILGNNDNRLIDGLNTVDAGDLDIYDKSGHLMFETMTEYREDAPDNAVWIKGFRIHTYNVQKTSSDTYEDSNWVPDGYIELSCENGFGEFDIRGDLIYGNKDNKWFSRISHTNKQIISDIGSDRKEFGMQIIPMSLTENGYTHKGIAFLRMDAES